MKNQIVQNLSSLFLATDRRNWAEVESVMAEEVLLDYSSMTGIPPSKQSPGQIADAWAALLPGYDKTHHQISGFEVAVHGDKATAHFTGTADHFMGGEVYTVEGTYDTELMQAGDNWLITKFKFNLLKTSGNKSLPEQAIAKAKEKGIRKVEFLSEGLTLKGNLHLPSNFNENKIYKGIVVTGSWTTVKEQMPDLYAVKLANQGFVGLTFDFSTYGESEGEPRNYEVLENKAQDIINAVNYLKTLSFIDGGHIGGLGICASSGAMALAITNGADFKAINFVAPWLHNPELIKPLYGGEAGVADKIKQSDEAGTIYRDKGEVLYVPAASATDKSAAMPGDFPYYLDPKRGAIKEWVNQFAVMAWRGWLQFDAIQYAGHISIPVQMIHSLKAAVPDGAKQFYENLAGPKNIIWVDNATQFDFYDQEPYTSNAATDTVNWFKQTLGGKTENAAIERELANH